MERWLRLGALLILGCSAGGCVAAGALAYKLSPMPTVPAEYKLPKHDTLVFVENYQNPDLVQLAAERLERDISGELIDHKVAPVVAPEKLLDLRNNKGQAFHAMNIPTVGNSLGARQVIYVDLLQFSVEPQPGSEMMKGKAQAMVKLIDAQTGRTMWPRETSAGREVKVETPYLRPENGATPDGVQEEMFHTLADKIAKLFYDWQSEDVDGSEPTVEPVR